jgi:hypothetical protein
MYDKCNLHIKEKILFLSNNWFFLLFIQNELSIQPHDQEVFHMNILGMCTLPINVNVSKRSIVFLKQMNILMQDVCFEYELTRVFLVIYHSSYDFKSQSYLQVFFLSTR